MPSPADFAKAGRKADKLRLSGADLTVTLCRDTKEAGCASAAAMKASWKHLRKRAKELHKAGVTVAAVPALCVDVCKAGPLAAVSPDRCAEWGSGPPGSGPQAWYGGCTPAVLDRLLAAHLSLEKDAADPADHRLPTAD